MKMHWKYIVISLLIGGFLGSAMGILGMRCYYQGGKHGHMRQKFYKELKLTPEQKTKVDAIMQGGRQKMESLRNATRQEIRRHLTPEQQITFDAHNAKREARRKKRTERIRG